MRDPQRSALYGDNIGLKIVSIVGRNSKRGVLSALRPPQLAAPSLVSDGFCKASNPFGGSANKSNSLLSRHSGNSITWGLSLRRQRHIPLGGVVRLSKEVPVTTHLWLQLAFEHRC
jgi:hypothetical protein